MTNVSVYDSNSKYVRENKETLNRFSFKIKVQRWQTRDVSLNLHHISPRIISTHSHECDFSIKFRNMLHSVFWAFLVYLPLPLSWHSFIHPVLGCFIRNVPSNLSLLSLPPSPISLCLSWEKSMVMLWLAWNLPVTLAMTSAVSRKSWHLPMLERARKSSIRRTPML